jgi:parvulin-like peptidyl-prolyl isomerase
MRSRFAVAWIVAYVGIMSPVLAQQAPPAAPPAAPAPAPGGIAATVNGQPLPEVAVQRGLRRVPPERQPEVRAQIIEFLVGNVLIDQYLLQHRIDVPKKEVDARVEQLREEIKKQGQAFEKVMHELLLTEQELREQITADLRWEKYLDTQITDKALREFFDKNPEMFDGTTVRARHILLSPAPNDAQGVQQAKAHLLQVRQQIETEVTQALAKVPPQTDNLEREKTRWRLTEDAFAAAARAKSACPSQAQGGDLGWFPRAGSMVEPFAKAAFELKPYQMSDIVATQFGLHLILATDRRPGKETKFDEVKEIVREVYGERLRDAITAQARPVAKVVVNAAPKP